MKYIAHIDGEREQTNKEHAVGTAKRAEKFATSFGKGDWGYACGMIHDVGKYSLEFQKRITGGNHIRVDHSTAGAKLCMEMGGYYSFLSYCIAGHHAGLPDTGNTADIGAEPTLKGRLKKEIKDFQAYKKDIEIPEIKSQPFDLGKTTNRDFSLSVFIRMIYSCLVDADFLDTEEFMRAGKTERESGESMAILCGKLQNHIAGWLKNEEIDTVNGRRTEILKHCMEKGKSERGLFCLTVPTGGGKTIASLAFAIEHALANQMERIIYVIPYTSIIEQNAKIFREILGEQNVLENHYNMDYESSEEFKPMQLAAENWDKPVIVTTNVQFFESLFANKSSKCRKLHNIANSVVIFDEAQMLPLDYLKPCVAMIEELLQNYRTSMLLCTATQPALKEFFQKNTEAEELCPRVKEQFEFFKRVEFLNWGNVTEEKLVENICQEEQALCIVNTKKKAQYIYEQLKGSGVYHLSTTMCPKHRKETLEVVRKRLKEGQRCILISTSLVEAGVDLDFQTVYRQIAGLDSMIQAAGRCNREGKRPVNKSKVLLFEFKEKEYVPAQRKQIDASKILMAEKMEISDLETITKYFEILYQFKGEALDKKHIMEKFWGTKYNFAEVGWQFRLIEEDTKTILIHWTEEAEELLKQIKYKGFTKKEMRRAEQYCIQVYNTDFEKLEAAGMIIPVSEDIQDFYELADKNQYTEDMGLKLDVDFGMGVIW